MKKSVIAHPRIHISEHDQVESYRVLWSYFYPELVTAFLLYTALSLIDSKFIASLGNTSAYATLGITDTLFHFITKIAEGVSVAMVVLCGQYNGIEAYHKTGKVVTDAFWVTAFLGALAASLLYGGAFGIYAFYGVPQEMVSLGVPFLRLRAMGVFFNFIYFALIGFLRGIKNTRVPMMLFLLGSGVFLFFDYALIFGMWGFPRLGFQGSAVASVIQYGAMLIGAIAYIFTGAQNRKYALRLFSPIRWETVKSLVKLSWPVMVDKASLAVCYIWLAKMVACMAHDAPAQAAVLPTYSFIKCIFQVALLPGLAAAQVITFLVSNDYKAHNWQRIKNNIMRVLFASTILVGCSLLALMLSPRSFLSFFDKCGTFTDFAARVVPFMCMFVFLDLMQLILAAALRGAANVRTVMLVRSGITILYFMPTSYALSLLPIDNILIKFILVYGSLYVGNAIMSLIYIRYFAHDAWKQQSVKGV
jgi:putative MATE family efflux protein